ncbi:MAG TPA: hypothetical protein VFH80_10630 [Solirubrobacteraceae bacterium]|nr:hypothetical protein [Solirubrobacteraceae bacterium]
MRVSGNDGRIGAAGSRRELGVAGSSRELGVARSSHELGVVGSSRELGVAGSSHELAGAEQLVSDLAALLDAGLVVVQEHVLGPARYGVAPVEDRRDGRPHRARAGHPAMIGGAVVD